MTTATATTMTRHDRPLVVGCLLAPRFSLMAFTTAVEPLRAANRISGRALFEWRVLTADGRPVEASNGVVVNADGVLADAGPLDMLMVVIGLDPHLWRDEKVIAQLRRMARIGVRIGGIGGGAYALARAGLLDGYRATIHWEDLTGFVETFPRLDVTGRLFEVDRDRFTCAGGTAPLDLALHFISTQFGLDLARAVADEFVHFQLRQAETPQRQDLRQRLGVSHPKLLAAITEIEANPVDPLSRAALARRVGLSTRQLERLFRIYLDCTPSQYYLESRLKHARLLLSQTSMSVLEVAVASGFASASHFAKCYRTLFGLSPKAERAPRPSEPVFGQRRSW